MGAPEDDEEAGDKEKPQHRVTLTKPFQIGATEVTVQEFAEFVTNTGYVTEAESDGKGSIGPSSPKRSPELTWRRIYSSPSPPEQLPVTCVSFKDAEEFCKWLGQQDGAIYRLPTEAEWEFTCRAGTSTRYWFGDLYDPEKAISKASTLRAIQPVNSLSPNPFGLFHVHGNVNELCLDSGRTYTSDPVVDPQGTQGETAIVRSGASSSHPIRLRSSHRYTEDQRHFPVLNFATAVKGFRVVRIDDKCDSIHLNVEKTTAPAVSSGPP